MQYHAPHCHLFVYLDYDVQQQDPIFVTNQYIHKLLFIHWCILYLLKKKVG